MAAPTRHPLIFGFTGLIASGKSSCSKHLEKKHGALTFKMSAVLREVLAVLSLENTRDNLISVSETLRAKFGEDLLSRAIIGKIAQTRRPLIVIEGLRHLSDLANFEKLPNFILVAVNAEAKTRFARLTGRTENHDDGQKTYRQFLADHRRSTEKFIPAIMARAKENLDNNGGPTALKTQLDELVKKYQSYGNKHQKNR